MKIIKTSNVKEIEWLLKERHIIKGTDLDFSIFEVEEDIIVPNFEEIKQEVKEKKILSKSTQEVTPNGVIKDKKIKKEKSKKKK